ncbi:MAG: 2-hydroxyglutaryl-CoA dehydratase, partial [Ruminococcaceae bacterium]|nr:2-hydroxyglutaryl-CoA dehydratase [Oscillospiraceae bacterium]
MGEMILKEYRAGIDIGSTTVKLVVLDAEDNIIYGQYRRHMAKTQETLASLLREAKETLGDCALKVKITGSGSINLAKALGIEFIQEVVAVATALKKVAPQTDVAIELGGEDAKIIYFAGGLEERMNGVCAGGTGSFIDQMAALLQTDAEGLNKAAENYKEIYPIAARCGVFAKTDIQPLINEGATTADLAASIFQAVVNQTISGLACGKPIRGCVAFLGGPLHFMPELKKAFIRTLKLTDETTVDPENSHLFAAMGAALEADKAEAINANKLMERLSEGVKVTYEMPRLEPLFATNEEYDEFKARHEVAVVPKGDLSTYNGDAFLGIDAGSTTTKMVLIGAEGELLFSFYANNKGDPIKTAKEAIGKLKEQMHDGVHIVRSCSTGYGEALLKSAFSLDEGEVETIAHTTAASFFNKNVDCVLDIGGQDMKCIKLKGGAVDSILLNEACSSGCGSFIENFANSLGFTAESFAKEALFAKAPVDLGTRCTVFMNSNVKQAQKEGATVSDISAGLAYSVIKNALYKVIKLADAKDLGKNIVVQGGTFHNEAVLRAFEKVAGVEATCPDISGLMGAFGAALIAKQTYHGKATTMLSLEQIESLTYTTMSRRCGGCANNCMLTINRFSNEKRHITGNRCEKGIGDINGRKKAPNMMEYKRKRIFDYEPLDEKAAPRGVIGIPRVLNMYENYPFWATFFKALGFRVMLSPWSSRKIYELGMDSIPSESECYPAKLSHGHVEWLIGQGVKTIFHPCIYFEHQEIKTAGNHYNCPIVISYAENLKNNVDAITRGDVRLVRPFMAFTSEKIAADRLVKICREEWNIPEKEVRCAASLAWKEQRKAKADILEEGRRLLSNMEAARGKGIVLAGRPYHIDPEINHGIPELITSYGFYVFTEDSLPVNDSPERPLRVVDQWAYHSRLYAAAELVRERDDLDLIQLNSFGCGLDAVTTDQVGEILEGSNKLYTLLKIDEVNNLGAVRIRIRSLISAIRMREKQNIHADPKPTVYKRAEYTKKMQDEGYTILAPQMLPIHFGILEPVCRKHGYNIVILDNDNRKAIDTGLKYVNNDACFPSITVVGQFMEAVTSGRYDTDRLAILMTQTGGCCRASNYVSFIRRALDKAGYSHIPVISLNLNGMEKNEGFKFTLPLLMDAVHALFYGDLIMRCLYRTRPYELTPGSANELHKKLEAICIDSLTNPNTKYTYKNVCNMIVDEFDNLP